MRPTLLSSVLGSLARRACRPQRPCAWVQTTPSMLQRFGRLGVCLLCRQQYAASSGRPCRQAGRQSRREATQAHMAAGSVFKQDMPLSACLLCAGVVPAGLAPAGADSGVVQQSAARAGAAGAASSGADMATNTFELVGPSSSSASLLLVRAGCCYGRAVVLCCCTAAVRHGSLCQWPNRLELHNCACL